ncbi:hypothetical protein ACFPRL_11785 [Pseudoclavibacter helvolus]
MARFDKLIRRRLSDAPGWRFSPRRSAVRWTTLVLRHVPTGRERDCTECYLVFSYRATVFSQPGT